MKVRILAALALVLLAAAVLPPVPVRSQMGGGFTCVHVEEQRMSATYSAPVLRPYKSSDENTWHIDQQRGLVVVSTGEVLNLYDHMGEYWLVWMPEDDYANGFTIRIASYQQVADCEPVVQFYADSTSLSPGECTYINWYVDNVSGLYGVYFGDEMVYPGADYRQVCPSADSAYFLRVTAGWGEISSRVDIRVSAPPTSTRVPSATPRPTSTTRPTAVPQVQQPQPQPQVQQPQPQVQQPQAPAVAASEVLELNINPIDQRLDPPVTLSNGLTDNGWHDCFVAAITMAMEYYHRAGVLADEDYPGYRAMVVRVRGTNPQTVDLTADPAFVSEVTHGKLTAQARWVPTNELITALGSELRNGDPVLAMASNGSLLAAGWQGMLGHSVLVYGLHDGRVYYADPWGGGRWDMSEADFVTADTLPDGSFIISFERGQP